MIKKTNVKNEDCFSLRYQWLHWFWTCHVNIVESDLYSIALIGIKALEFWVVSCAHLKYIPSMKIFDHIYNFNQSRTQWQRHFFRGRKLRRKWGPTFWYYEKIVNLWFLQIFSQCLEFYSNFKTNHFLNAIVNFSVLGNYKSKTFSPLKLNINFIFNAQNLTFEYTEIAIDS